MYRSMYAFVHGLVCVRVYRQLSSMPYVLNCTPDVRWNKPTKRPTAERRASYEEHLLRKETRQDFTKWEFPKIRGTLFWGLFNKDPTIWGTI